MKAAVVPTLGAPLEIRDVPIPEPGPGQVLVRIETCGLCHTDIHAARGEWPVKPKDQLIPGHEGVGIVEAVGSADVPVAVGQRVALPWLGHACGQCRYCVDGWETYCTAPAYMGYTMDGGYAEYAVAFASHVVPVPDGIDPVDASPLTCAGVTTYKALKVAEPKPDETCMVVGIGGLGHLGLQYARIFGCRTVAVDVHDDKLQLAKDLGTDHVVDARGDQAAQLAQIGGVDIALVTVPSPAAMRAAHAALNPNGRLVLVGLPADNRLEIPVFETVLKGVKVIGSLVGTRNDLATVFDLHARGLTRVVTETRQLDDVNACFEEVLAGEVPARLVFDMR
ncbi:alcohol dehydrogenase catalytic domain-containing protein [Nocardioides okcheonensis]|uniref:alcohol dehydrogenase catalytic domain-containing protein n=1 Tax=Nocardioides okcheonensis TaxID=2894081 RepID=UPI001E3436FA|nr:zinc-dependent alcohol dehydrogenase [Nocardioides okcheonensis]UFN46429.1 zinc-dependent alcohol dehydrogenase [Nocardioides okcheonensis]